MQNVSCSFEAEAGSFEAAAARRRLLLLARYPQKLFPQNQIVFHVNTKAKAVLLDYVIHNALEKRQRQLWWWWGGVRTFLFLLRYGGFIIRREIL